MDPDVLAEKKRLAEGFNLLMRNVPMYDGVSNVTVFFRTWENAKETAVELMGLTEPLMARALRMLLAPNAAEALAAMDPSASLSELEEAIKSRFGERKSQLQLFMELTSTTQQPGRPMTQYVTFFEKRIRQAGVTTAGLGTRVAPFLIAIFVNGVSNPNIRRELLLRNPTTWAETVSTALQLDVGRSAVRSDAYPSLASVSRPPSGPRHGSRPDRDRPRFTSSASGTASGTSAYGSAATTVKERERTPVCYGCNKPGHVQRDCPAQRRRPPNNPGATGVNLVGVAQPTTDHPVEELDDELYQGYFGDDGDESAYASSNILALQAEVTLVPSASPTPNESTVIVAMDICGSDGTTIRLDRVLVDSGAAVTVIDESVWKHTGPAISCGPPRELRGLFSQEAERVLTRPFPVQLSFAESPTWLPAEVFPVRALPYDMVMGTDLLRQIKGAVLNFTTMALTVNGACVSTARGKASEIPGPQTKPPHTQPTSSDPSTPALTLRSEDLRQRLETDYASAFEGAFSGQPATEATGVKHTIHLEPSATPHRLRAYPLSTEQATEMKKDLNKWEERGFIRRQPSAWGSPVIYVKKASWKGETERRFCVDYRGVNAKTLPLQYTLPRMEMLVRGATAGQLFTAIDFKKAYWQIAMDPESIDVTAMSTVFGTYVWLSLPFGLAQAPITQQQMCDHLFRDLVTHIFWLYIDDGLIFTTQAYDQLDGLIPDWADISLLELHDRHVRLVFDIILLANLRVSKDKCIYAATSVPFLGYVISHGHHSVPTDKTLAAANWPEPRTLPQVSRFIGFCSWLRDFVPHFETLAEPLRAMVREKTFTWGPAHRAAFTSLIRSIVQAPSLATPPPKTPLDFFADASGAQAGGILQWNGQPVAFLSFVLNPHQQNYSVREKELLAVVRGFRTWRTILLNHHVRVWSDHKSLSTIFSTTTSELTPRLARWHEFLSQFSYEITYVKGSANVAADALSRTMVLAHVTTSTGKDTKAWQRSLTTDEYFGPVVQTLLQSTPAASGKLAERASWFSVNKEDGLLYTAFPNQAKPRLVIPKTFEQETLELFHNASAHAGLQRCLDLLEDQVFFPKMRAKLSKHLEGCGICARVKAPHNTQYAIKPLDMAAGRWTHVAADFMMGLPATMDPSTRKLTVDSVLVVIDRFSHRVRLLPCHSTITSQGTATLFSRQVFAVHGYPLALYLDRDSKFTGKAFQQLCASKSIDLRFATTDKHVSIAERAIRSVQTALRAVTNTKGDDWLDYLPDVEFAINSLPSTTTEVTPFELDLGYRPRWPGLPLQAVSSASLQDLRADHQRFVNVAQDALRRAREARAAESDKLKVKRALRVGDSVYVATSHLNVDLSRNNSGKLTDRFTGPYIITEALANDNFRIELPFNSKANAVFHSSKLKSGPAFDSMRAEPVLVNGEEHFEVESILDHRMARGRLQYLVLWLGYPATQATWINDSKLVHCREAIDAYRRARTALDESTTNF